MKKILTLLVITAVSAAGLSAQENERKTIADTKAKYSFLNKKCSPFVGARASEIFDVSNNGLRLGANPYIGIDISRFSVKVGYEFHYGLMGAGIGTVMDSYAGAMKNYIKIGIGYTF